MCLMQLLMHLNKCENIHESYSEYLKVIPSALYPTAVPSSSQPSSYSTSSVRPGRIRPLPGCQRYCPGATAVSFTKIRCTISCTIGSTISTISSTNVVLE